MKFIPLLLLLTSLTFANPLGTGWDTVLDSCSGDLDKDGVPEKVQVVGYHNDRDSVLITELQIFKIKLNKPDSLWVVTRNPVSCFFDNAACRTTIENLTVERGAVVIKHNTYCFSHLAGGIIATTRYRLNHGAFKLIGITFNKVDNCNNLDWKYLPSVITDINFSTGKGILSYKYEQCNEDSPVKLPSNKSITFILDQCTATKTVNGKQQKLTVSDLKNITIANHKYGEISLTIKGESISF